MLPVQVNTQSRVLTGEQSEIYINILMQFNSPLALGFDTEKLKHLK